MTQDQKIGETEVGLDQLQSAFELLEERRPSGSKLLYSGLSDYVLDIYAFVRDSRGIAVYPDVQRALSYLTVERGKIGTAAPRDSRRRV